MTMTSPENTNPTEGKHSVLEIFGQTEPEPTKSIGMLEDECSRLILGPDYRGARRFGDQRLQNIFRST